MNYLVQFPNVGKFQSFFKISILSIETQQTRGICSVIKLHDIGL